MGIPKEAYQAFEEIVGKDHISCKEYILAGNRSKTPEVPFLYHTADAILLPGSTEEVQKIVRICNQYDICFVVSVSGASAEAYANRAGTILIDLRRMNRILEINTEDRYVVVEPGVRHVQLYPELRKLGFSYVTAAVGPGGSVLANFTSSSGDNHNQHGTSRANRYLLSVEMVTPDGEIIKTGSLGTGSGWFCPDGPGPGLRGMIKGYFGNHGQLGIITKAAIALNPCKGPKEIRMEGRVPHSKTFMEDDKNKVFIFTYPDLDGLMEAMMKIGEAEIGSTVQKFFYMTLAMMMTDSANAFFEIWEDIKSEMAKPLVVHLATNSAEELAYEEKILMDIIHETGGKRARPDIENWWVEHMDFFMVVSMLQRVLRLGGGWMPNKLATDSVPHMFEVAKRIPEFFLDFTETGKMFDAPENYQIVPTEYGHFAHIELLVVWNRLDAAARASVGEFLKRSREIDLKHHLHASTTGSLNAQARALGPLYCNYDQWLEKIKNAFDPNNIANPLL